MSQIRAAFDLGSSHHKLVVALHRPYTTPLLLFSTSVRIPLADSLTASNTLPPSALLASSLAVARLHALALEHGATAFAAVATAVFRAAVNGPAHLAALPVPVSVLDAQTEGRLAYASAMVSVQRDVPRDCVVWDSGGASTQWCLVGDRGDFSVRTISVGSSSVRARYRGQRDVGELRRWVRRVAGSPGEVLARKLRDGGVVLGIGSAASMFALAAGRVGRETFGEGDVWEAVREVERAGEEGDVVTVLPKLVLLAELMGAYGIGRVRYVEGNGSCVGLLASEEERFWGRGNETAGRRGEFLGVKREEKIFAEGARKTGVTPSC